MTLPTDVLTLRQELTMIADRLKARGQVDRWVLAQTMANKLADQVDPLPKALLGNAQAVLRHFGRV